MLIQFTYDSIIEKKPNALYPYKVYALNYLVFQIYKAMQLRPKKWLKRYTIALILH